MTIGPFTGDTKRVRAAFAGLKSLFQELKEGYPELNLDTLSMGMSGDFKIAVEEGSTLIRIGAALFGAREGWST
ncbi:Pyridoxal phosphate homeostasis protein [subsurface metagenome]